MKKREGEWFSERRLADMLGLERVRLREARGKMGEGEWGLLGAQIALTEKGVRGVLKVLGVELPEGGERGGVTMGMVLGRAKIEQDELAYLRRMRGRFCPCVVTRPTGSRRMVMGVLEGGGGEVRLIVGGSANRGAGDVVVARQVAGDMWEEFEVISKAGARG